MDTMELLGKAQDAATVNRVFGEPITRDGITVIPAARVAGGGGGGTGKQEGEQPGEGTGGGFGLGATPAGMIVIKDGEVRWRPAVDVNKIILGGQIVAIVALLTVRTVMRVLAKSKAFRRK